MRVTKTRANLMLLLAAIIWGAGYIFSKMATNAHMQAGLINAIRGFVYAGLAFIFFHKAIFKMTGVDFRIGLTAGFINFLGYQFQTWGLKSTTPSNNAFLTAIYVVMIPFIVWVLFHRRPELKSYVAILIAMVGMMFLTNVLQHGFTLHIGDLLTIISAFFYALQIVYFSMRTTSTSPLSLSFMLGLTQGTFGLIWSLLFEHATYGVINWQAGLWPVIVLGILSSFGAQTLQIVGQRYTDPVPAGVILMTESMFGSIFSVVLGFEPFTSNLLIGGSLIIVALLIMQLNFKQH
ncbi:transport protein [Secundilactobacillus odoratitofui DSM 19909 = JCM 15043]|uniref:Transport protein n=1 Tax=Secundilactobacillus odoratitofui DSM 19909 = JCM 15043 TaxID=1423776 RepID=A0A0R1LSL5_9LACO|nr:DMT family transporter [Secundilactobacillus odoratitofui]KRK98763.1 transport protein [Secundilactobacillus odoratitofui DSM 19909 = JCM 15043]